MCPCCQWRPKKRLYDRDDVGKNVATEKTWQSRFYNELRTIPGVLVDVLKNVSMSQMTFYRTCLWRRWRSKKLGYAKKLKIKRSSVPEELILPLPLLLKRLHLHPLFLLWRYFGFGCAAPPRILSILASSLLEHLDLLLRGGFFIGACTLPVCNGWRRLSLPVAGVLLVGIVLRHPGACRRPPSKFFTSLLHRHSQETETEKRLHQKPDARLDMLVEAEPCNIVAKLNLDIKLLRICNEDHGSQKEPTTHPSLRLCTVGQADRWISGKLPKRAN